MYSDQDGTATKQSQATYENHIRRLLFTSSLLSWLGFVAAALNNEYMGDNLRVLVNLREISIPSVGQLLWASHFSLIFRILG